MKIFVIKGGFSVERNVSLVSGAAIEKALKNLCYPFWSWDLSQENIWDMVSEIKKVQPDVVFNALHGKFGEDGTIQAILDALNVNYTHSGVLASSLGMNKVRSRLLFEKIGIPTPTWSLTSWQDIRHDRYPFIIKPISEGSSIGVSLIKNAQDLENARKNWTFEDTFLIEEYLKGREIHVPILDDVVLGTVEIINEVGILDYDGKYVAGKSQRITPAPLSPQENEMVQALALKAHRILGCKGLTRTEFILSDGVFYILEINTQPGLTPTSFAPLVAQQYGWSFEQLVNQMLQQPMQGRKDLQSIINNRLSS